MNNILQVFQERQDDFWLALLEHLQISLLALIIAILIAVPFSVLIFRNKRISNVILQIAGVFQTIPSLALLGLFIPFMGIGRLPAIVALVIYAIFPIMQSTITGLQEIDPSLEEAATAFGMSKMDKLMKFELEIAMPMIISGVRTSGVMIIGTATLAALIGAGGLGSFILLGIDRNNTALILIGAISSALLAIAFNYGVKILEKRRLKTIGITLLALVAILFGTMIPSGGQGNQLVVGGKLGTEPDILINMYKILIEDGTDIQVEVKPNFGKTSFLYEAVKAGEIDIYPEFTGTVTGSLLENPPELSNDPREVYEAARDGLYEQDKIVLLEPMLYQNTYAVAVKRSYAEANNLEKISDLRKVQDSAVAGFTLEFNDREDGNIGLQNIYGLNLDVRTMEPALRYTAINNDEIQITDAYSTDSEIKEYDLVILEDDMMLFPPYQGTPLMLEETLEDYPELEEILNALGGQITEDEMIEMNFRANGGEAPYDLALEYLQSKGFIE